MTESRPHTRRRVLISAYACEPGKGSEPGVGWNISLQLAKNHDVWVLTRSNNREIIERELRGRPLKGLHFLYHDLPVWLRWWKKFPRGIQLYYYLWQLSAVPLIRRKHSEINFEIAQHITFVKYWVPSCLAWLNIPFVWGPVGGADGLPPIFLKKADLKAKLFERLRENLRRISHYDPFVRRTARNAAACIAVTPQTAKSIQKLNPGLAISCFSQVGVSQRALHRLAATVKATRKDSGLRFICVGNLLFLKGIHLAIRAFSKAEIQGAKLLIVGDGPERAHLKNLTEALGITDNVHFHGKLPRNETLRQIASSDVVVHTSFHDSGGFVLIEAMALSRPLICLNLAGPSVIASDETALRINPISPEQTVSDVAEAMEKLNDPEERKRLGRAGKKRIEEKFLWHQNVAAIERIYEDVLKLS